MPPPVVLALFEAPVVVAVAAGPPAFELPPAVLDGDWANAIVLDRASAIAAMEILFMLPSSDAEAILNSKEGSTNAEKPADEAQ